MIKREITNIQARQIFDSRGTPTIKCRVCLSDGSFSEASVPSGASTGKYEAHELRDDEKGYNGKGVLKAIYNINNDLANLLKGKNAEDICALDDMMKKLDSTSNLSRIGGNAILAVSLACVKAVTNSYSIPLYKFIGGINANKLPIPLMNILNGGQHAGNNLDIQEFMILPVGANSFAQAMKIGTEVYSALKKLLKENFQSTSVGDEGGFAPNLENDAKALDYIVDAISIAGYAPGKDVFLALDIASSDWYQEGKYHLSKSKRIFSSMELEEYLLTLCGNYPIISLEDPMAEDDFEGFINITKNAGRVNIVGDDLFVTNPERIKKGIEMKAANSVLIKPNQIGTFSDTLMAINIAKEANYQTIISHRSGETEDTFIADLAVGVNSGFIKCGAPARSERLCKYNRLLQIEDELGKLGRYASKVI